MNELINNKQELKFFGVLFALLFIILLGSYVLEARVKRGNSSVPTEVAVAPLEVEIEGKAAFVYDIRTNTVLYRKNEDQRLPLASLTKVMAALVAVEETPEYTAVAFEGEKWLLKDLLDYTLTRSSNTGMEAVALALGAVKHPAYSDEEIKNDFVRVMNNKASELGMKNTYYFNVTGLDESDVKGGAYGTVRDMTVLFSYILENKPELLESTKDYMATFRTLEENIHVAKNTNTLVYEIPGIKASKTGYTDIAGGNLVIAFDPELGRPIIVAVLGSSEEGRFRDIIKLVEATMERIKDPLPTTNNQQ